jgi:hypothetical protein
VRVLRRVLTGAVVVLLLALLAAWQVPPRLNWARYRGSIAAFASERLGRNVHIGGQVRLALLPRVVLSADDVTLADRGDGISAKVGALRLQAAFWPLLRGRVVPRDLVLDTPVMNVPWPLPAAISVIPVLAPGFAADIEGGELHVGALKLTSVAATLHVDADTGAFGAQGTAGLQGHPCRFTALIGAPGGDGIATLTLTLDGQDGLQGSGGSFRGRILANGGVEGVAAARGPNFSLLLPAPAVPWRLQGAVLASAGEIRARDLRFMLANSPGQADVTLRITPPARIDAAVKVGQFELGAWLLGLGRPSLALPLHLDLRAQAATWHGRAVRDPALVVDLGGAVPGLAADAVLPGNARLHFSGSLQSSAAGAVLTGPVTLDVPDLAATASFVAGTAPGVPVAWATLPSPHAELRGRLRLADRQAELAGLTLKLGGSSVTGDAAFNFAAHPVFRAALSVDHLALPVSSAWPPWGAAKLPAILGAMNIDLDLQAGAVDLPFVSLTHAVMQAHIGTAGIALHHFAADLPGLHLDVGASVAPDFTLADAHLDATSNEAAALPAAWRIPPGLWHGPFHLALTASGPPRHIASVARADLGDLRAEAEGHIDTIAPRLTATITVRHPGTPRLLASLGLPDTQRWLDNGSLALQAHLSVSPGHVHAADFSLAAAALHAGGEMDADFSGPHPIVSGRIEAPSLTLPRFDARSQSPLPFATLAQWQGQIQLHAGTVSWGASTVATEASANLAGGFGVVTAFVQQAHIAGGQFAGALAIDTTQSAPLLLARGELAAAAPDDLPSPSPLAFKGGTVDLTTDLSAAGYSPLALLATLSGDAHTTLHGSALAGVDLPQLTKLLTARGPGLRGALIGAMANGDTGPLTGDAPETLRQGAVTIGQTRLAGDAGSVDIEGSIDLPARTSNLVLRFQPAVANPPVLGLRLAGAWDGGKRAVDVRPALVWAGEGTEKRKARGSAPRTPPGP